MQIVSQVLNWYPLYCIFCSWLQYFHNKTGAWEAK